MVLVPRDIKSSACKQSSCSFLYQSNDFLLSFFDCNQQRSAPSDTSLTDKHESKQFSQARLGNDIFSRRFARHQTKGSPYSRFSSRRLASTASIRDGTDGWRTPCCRICNIYSISREVLRQDPLLDVFNVFFCGGDYQQTLYIHSFTTDYATIIQTHWPTCHSSPT